MFDGKWKSPHDGGNRMNLYGCIRTRGGDDICYGNPGGKHTRGDVNRHRRVWDVQGLKDTICRCVFSHRLCQSPAMLRTTSLLFIPHPQSSSHKIPVR